MCVRVRVCVVCLERERRSLLAPIYSLPTSIGGNLPDSLSIGSLLLLTYAPLILETARDFYAFYNLKLNYILTSKEDSNYDGTCKF